MINLNELTQDQIRVLARMKQIGGERILEVIDLFIEDAKNSLVRADEMARVHRLQGRAEGYQDLKEAIEDASEMDV